MTRCTDESSNACEATRWAYRHTSSTKQLVNGESGCVQAWRRKDITLNIYQTKTDSLHNRLFAEPPTVYRGKHVVSRHVCRSYLKANKASKSELRDKESWIRISFLKVCWRWLPKIIKIGPSLSKLQLAKVGTFFETQCVVNVLTHLMTF